MKKFVIVMIVLIFIVFAVIGGAFFINNLGKKQSSEETTSEMKEKEENITNIVNKTENTVANENKNKIENKIEEETKEEDKKEEEKTTVPSPSTATNNSTETPAFVTDFDNYSPSSNEVIISESKAKEIAQIGFEESKKRIAGEGADDVASQRIKIEEVSPNNYFTRKDREYDKTYTNIKRKAYIVTRENDMGNGISIYVDATTGLIIGGRAFGD